ncbi:MAG: EAL domain-containing protein [Actinomycetota bacterium]|nr:EAL domain-containing protein [Actinomycetota bacterium]
MRRWTRPAPRCARAKLRRTGVRLSVDDTASGDSSLAHIINLSPDIIKVDLALTRGVVADSATGPFKATIISIEADGTLVLGVHGFVPAHA